MECTGRKNTDCRRNAVNNASKEPTKIDFNIHLAEWLTSSIQVLPAAKSSNTAVLQWSHELGLHKFKMEVSGGGCFTCSRLRQWVNVAQRVEGWGELQCVWVSSCVLTESAGINWCWGPADPCRRSSLTECRLEKLFATNRRVLCCCWIQHSLWRDPSAPANPFVFSANEILMRGPGPIFFHLFLHSFPLWLPLSLPCCFAFILDALLSCLSSLSLFLFFWCNLQADGGKKDNALFALCVCAFVCMCLKSRPAKDSKDSVYKSL